MILRDDLETTSQRTGFPGDISGKPNAERGEKVQEKDVWGGQFRKVLQRSREAEDFRGNILWGGGGNQKNFGSEDKVSFYWPRTCLSAGDESQRAIGGISAVQRPKSSEPLN